MMQLIEREFFNQTIKRLKFEDRLFMEKKVQRSSFHNIVFLNCKFSYTLFKHNLFSDCSFQHCVFDSIFLLKNNVENTIFHDCSFNDVNWDGNSCCQVRLELLNIIHSDFYNNLFDSCFFKQLRISKGYLENNSFLRSFVSEVSWKDVRKQKNLFAECLFKNSEICNAKLIKNNFINVSWEHNNLKYVHLRGNTGLPEDLIGQGVFLKRTWEGFFQKIRRRYPVKIIILFLFLLVGISTHYLCTSTKFAAAREIINGLMNKRVVDDELIIQDVFAAATFALSPLSESSNLLFCEIYSSHANGSKLIKKTDRNEKNLWLKLISKIPKDKYSYRQVFWIYMKAIRSNLSRDFHRKVFDEIIQVFSNPKKFHLFLILNSLSVRNICVLNLLDIIEDYVIKYELGDSEFITMIDTINRNPIAGELRKAIKPLVISLLKRKIDVDKKDSIWRKEISNIKVNW